MTEDFPLLSEDDFITSCKSLVGAFAEAGRRQNDWESVGLVSSVKQTHIMPFLVIAMLSVLEHVHTYVKITRRIRLPTATGSEVESPSLDTSITAEDICESDDVKDPVVSLLCCSDRFRKHYQGMITRQKFRRLSIMSCSRRHTECLCSTSCCMTCQRQA